MTREIYSLALGLCFLLCITAEAPAQLPLPICPSAPRENKEPEWLPLDPKVEEWVVKFLDLWEARNAEIKSLEGKFQMWKYDPAIIPNHFGKLQKQDKVNSMPATGYGAG